MKLQIIIKGVAATMFVASLSGSLLANKGDSKRPSGLLQTMAEEDAVIVPDSARKGTVQAGDEGDEVYSICEKEPFFPGGQEALKNFIRENLRYPEQADVQGKVYVGFVVEKDGSISDVQVIRGIPGFPKFDEEALRVIKSMSKWTSGEVGGKKVRAKYTVPVSFKRE